ncbi:hypothetical protein BJ912DRAFT_1066454 [Pholiota molesta]|nr:hypothetical protein BJ912DRAFT_1066454 [Pholiota molesta]
MPRLTERQEATRNLLEAYVAHTLAVMEADATRVDDESEDDDSDSDSSISLSPSSRQIPKTKATFRLLLDVYRYDFPDIFRSFFRVTPDCFNDLVAAVSNHPVFYNGSNNEQIPIEDQVAIALYRFGHYGNAISTIKVSVWAGMSMEVSAMSLFGS